jgi:hypothetical protein
MFHSLPSIFPTVQFFSKFHSTILSYFRITMPTLSAVTQYHEDEAYLSNIAVVDHDSLPVLPVRPLPSVSASILNGIFFQ